MVGKAETVRQPEEIEAEAEAFVAELFEADFEYKPELVGNFLYLFTMGQGLPEAVAGFPMAGFVRQVLVAQCVIRTRHAEVAKRDARVAHLQLQGASHEDVMRVVTDRVWSTIRSEEHTQLSQMVNRAQTNIASSFRTIPEYSGKGFVGMINNYLRGTEPAVPIPRKPSPGRHNPGTSRTKEVASALGMIPKGLRAGFGDTISEADRSLLEALLLGYERKVTKPAMTQEVLKAILNMLGEIRKASPAPDNATALQKRHSLRVSNEDAAMLKTLMHYDGGPEFEGYRRLKASSDESEITLRYAIAKAIGRVMVLAPEPKPKAPEE